MTEENSENNGDLSINQQLDRIRKEIGVDALSLFQSQPEKEEVHMLAWSGEKPREKAPFSLSPLGTVAKTGKGILIEKKHQRPDKFQSLVVVPVGTKEQPIGVLFAASTELGFFKSEKKLAAIRSIAEYYASVLGAVPTATPIN